MARRSSTKVLFIGLNPSGKPIRKGCAWEKLMYWKDILGLDVISFTNLSFDEDWDFKTKSLDLEFLRASIEGHKHIISLGTQVHDTLRRIGIESFKMPHPSPRNRLLNNREYEEQCLIKCMEYISEDRPW